MVLRRPFVNIPPIQVGRNVARHRDLRLKAPDCGASSIDHLCGSLRFRCPVYGKYTPLWY